jgi:SAM-dependent methyltransferase
MTRPTSDQNEWLDAVAPYRILAKVYDAVMEHVDYDFWAHYVAAILERHGVVAESVLELGCGTGSFALAFQHFVDVEYVATDGVPEMVERARSKLQDTRVAVELADFASFSIERQFDVILMLYDCLNYMLEEREIASFLSSCYKALAPGGLLVFDQSTPANSENNEGDFDYVGRSGTLEFERRSSYDKRKRTHVTDFTIFDGANQYWERHRQRAHTRMEVQAVLEDSPFDILASYEDFTFQPGSDSSERLHWVVQRKAHS